MTFAARTTLNQFRHAEDLVMIPEVFWVVIVERLFPAPGRLSYFGRLSTKTYGQYLVRRAL